MQGDKLIASGIMRGKMYHLHNSQMSMFCRDTGGFGTLPSRNVRDFGNVLSHDAEDF